MRMYHPAYGWLQDDHIYQRIIGWRVPMARWAGGDLNWMFGKAGTGPAGTGHWAVGLRPMEWNLALMSSRQFQNYLQNYYGINLNTNDGRWEAALAMSQRPTASEFSSYIAPALGAKGIVFDNEAWLTVTIKPAVYAGGLEAENQIAMGLTVAINISLGILKKDYLGALSMRNNLTQGESLPVLQAGLSGVDINVMEGYFIAWEGGMFKEEQRIEKLLKSNASKGQRHFLKNGLKNVRALGAAAGAIGVGLSWYEASQKDTAGAYSLATVDTIMVGVGIFFPVIGITYGLVRFGLDIAGVDLAGGIDTGINYFLGN